eukprot:CAMPEP_0178452698 /NCGR_PEP_ID=MMETSP0689_2-20121128/44388_1 /TAXON_ID=160604 /ORGANISM="Amphidinium massartii, Strain CS-259" /LENGTH=34 /DNA_ID= /DNA_START= /DNA_END= /DNA_ORIENTATION=
MANAAIIGDVPLLRATKLEVAATAAAAGTPLNAS